MHIHAYKLKEEDTVFRLALAQRLSTDAAGVAECLGIQAETKVELEAIIAELEAKISARTLLTVETGPTPSCAEIPSE